MDEIYDSLNQVFYTDDELVKHLNLRADALEEVMNYLGRADEFADEIETGEIRDIIGNALGVF